jgi:hypothetical protein
METVTWRANYSQFNGMFEEVPLDSTNFVLSSAMSADADIWETVFNIINILSAFTPPPSSIAPTFRGTPIKSSSGRLTDGETRDIVEGELFEEIRNCTFRNMGGFWDKFFDSKSWHKEQKAMLKGVLTAHDGKRWTDFPTIPDEKPVWDWLRSLEEYFLDDAPYKFHTTRTANQFKERKGQMDLFLQRPAAEGSDTFWCKHVLVGEQKKSYDTSRFKADFLQLTRYVRSVFADQPTRRYVHAFFLCASKMELWIFVGREHTVQGHSTSTTSRTSLRALLLATLQWMTI